MKDINTKHLYQGIISGERRALSRAITLIESSRSDHRKQAIDLLAKVRLFVKETGQQALRLGLSGTPGAGKSTLIENFGLMLVSQGLKVAVLAIDPSSSRSGGSILGDKTRMEYLSRSSLSFIRPSPSQTQMGGVARRTREAVALCESAGFDVIIIETVGVGQSETMVADLCDIFLLLLAPAGGDELQGVKRGIMEVADLIVVNKADGDLKPTAIRTATDYAGALRLMRHRQEDPEGFPKALTVSALEKTGLNKAWSDIQTLANWRKENGFWQSQRANQAKRWFLEELSQGLLSVLKKEPLKGIIDTLGNDVATGSISPEEAAEQILSLIRHTS